MKKSVLTRIFILMNVVFVGLMCVFVLTIALLSRSSFEIIRKNRQQMTIHYVKTAETTFSTIEVHLTEIMTGMLSGGSTARLRSSVSYERAGEARKYYELLDRKCKSVDGMDIAFILDTTGQTKLWACGDDIGASARKAFRSFMESGAPDVQKFMDTKWHPCSLGTETYYARVCTLNGFLVGALCCEKHFSRELRAEMGNGTDAGYRWDLEKEDGTLLYRYPPGGPGEQQRQERRETTVRISQPFEKAGGVICFLFPENMWGIWKNTSIIFTVVFWIVCLLLEGMVYRTFRDYVRKPVERLVVASNEIIGGNYNASVEENGEGELLVLEQAFNAAIHTVVGLRIEAYEQELRAREQELAGLRQQLGPHFYLNALSVVKGMAYQHRTDEIQKYIELLTVHIRYLLNRNQTRIPLGEEFEHVSNYVGMQKICMPGKITAFLSCEPGCRETKVPYLLLHTIVENAFKYARTENNSLIFTLNAAYVREEQFQGVLIEYEDTGTGFTEEMLDSLENATAAEEQHVGLANLRRTMEIQYGDRHLLKIMNAQPHGARIEIRIPELHHVGT